MASTHQSQITHHNVSKQAKHAKIFPTLHPSLISIGKLRDDECIVTFEKQGFVVKKHNEILLKDIRIQ